MRNRVAVLTITMVLPLTAVAALAAAPQAAADPRSREVVVTGAVDDCDNGRAPLRVRITTGQETVIDRNQGVRRAGAYSATFQNIPRGSGVKARAIVICANDSYANSFRIVRPPTAQDLVQRVNLS